MFKNKILFLLSCLILSSSIVTNVSADAKEPWQGAYTSEAYAGGAIRKVFCSMVELVEGNFGALLFSAAGLVAIAMGAFGQGGQSKNIFIVSISALTISTAVSLYFGDMGCGNGSSGGGKKARTIKSQETTITNAFNLPLLNNDSNEEPTVPLEDTEHEESEAELF